MARKGKSQQDIDIQLRRINRLAESSRVYKNLFGISGEGEAPSGDIPQRNMARLAKAEEIADRYKRNMRNSSVGRKLEATAEETDRNQNSAYGRLTQRADYRNLRGLGRNLPKYYQDARKAAADAFWATQEHKYTRNQYMGVVG